VLLWGPTEGIVSTTKTSKVVGDGPCAFEMELVSVLEFVCDGLWIPSSNEEIIDVHGGALTVVTTMAHPDVILSL
jgi:hypothetical protein